MIVESQEIILTLPEGDRPRGKGLHQSAIIRAVATEYGLLKQEWAEEVSLVDVRKITDQVAILRMSAGLAWEEYYIPRMGEITSIPELQYVQNHPGEIEYQGVYMNPDGESISTIFSTYEDRKRTLPIIHEVKWTYKSTNTIGKMDTTERLRKNWIWLAQMKAYCIARGTRFSWLHVYFVNGDYKRPLQPQLWLFRFEFTEDELQENWEFFKEYVQHKRIEEGM